MITTFLEDSPSYYFLLWKWYSKIITKIRSLILYLWFSSSFGPICKILYWMYLLYFAWCISHFTSLSFDQNFLKKIFAKIIGWKFASSRQQDACNLVFHFKKVPLKLFITVIGNLYKKTRYKNTLYDQHGIIIIFSIKIGLYNYCFMIVTENVF